MNCRSKLYFQVLLLNDNWLKNLHEAGGGTLSDLSSIRVGFLCVQSVSGNFSELPHDKTNKVACAPSEDSDQPGHSLST